ncbi:hypothetical protein J6590_039874 [Homalodisca vitripennis]|nr:hypothetical protein J6590_039874 [Homalodisca vitripennis]
MSGTPLYSQLHDVSKEYEDKVSEHVQWSSQPTCHSSKYLWRIESEKIGRFEPLWSLCPNCNGRDLLPVSSCDRGQHRKHPNWTLIDVRKAAHQTRLWARLTIRRHRMFLWHHLVDTIDLFPAGHLEYGMCYGLEVMQQYQRSLIRDTYGQASPHPIANLRAEKSDDVA